MLINFYTKVLLLSMISQLKIDEISIFYDEQKKYRCKANIKPL